jgi:hypothetical protein
MEAELVQEVLTAINRVHTRGVEQYIYCYDPKG